MMVQWVTIMNKVNNSFEFLCFIIFFVFFLEYKTAFVGIVKYAKSYIHQLAVTFLISNYNYTLGNI